VARVGHIVNRFTWRDRKQLHAAATEHGEHRIAVNALDQTEVIEGFRVFHMSRRG
jgi:hypothetical protein